MTRRYELRRRAERQAETRRRIVEAAVGLHTSVGYSRTTDTAIAERAGVSRLTFYRHFPETASLIEACTAHGLALMSPPDPRPWLSIRDPLARLRHGLTELYRYYRGAGPALLLVARETPQLGRLEREATRRVQLDHVRQVLPYGMLSQTLDETAPPDELEALIAIVLVLSRGWGARGHRRRRVIAAVNHAVAVTSWDSLVCRNGLSESEAIELLAAMVCAAVGAAGPAPSLSPRDTN